MNYARRIVLAAAPLLGCSGTPADTTGEDSRGGPAGSSSSGASEPTSGGSSSAESSGGSSSAESSGGSASAESSGGTSGESSTGGTSTGGESSTGDATSTGELTGELTDQAPDFMLIDVNPNSASFEQAVSPRDYLEKVSGWYFAHAT